MTETTREHYYTVLDSTMIRARSLAATEHRDDNCAAFWVRTDHQTAGRGRRDRSWVDSPGNDLLATYAIRRGGPLDPGDRIPGTLALRAAAAVYDTVHRHAPGVLSIKWPNDILLEGRKLAGILLEADPRWFYIGIGINVAGLPDDRDVARVDPTDLPPTSLAGVTTAPAPADLFPALQEHVRRYLSGEEWLELVDRVLAWRGRAVTVEIDGVVRSSGTLSGVARDGALLLESPRESVYAGTVRLK